MIAYDLQCINGHIFEGWFKNEEAYSEQNAQNLIACPVCNETSVSRIPSTFGIKGSQDLKDIVMHQEKLADLTNKIVDFVEKNFDDVGCNFAKEALKMHYGVSEPKNIRGVSTKEEEKILQKEGVQFIKIPVVTPTETDA